MVGGGLVAGEVIHVVTEQNPENEFHLDTLLIIKNRLQNPSYLRE